MLYVDTSAFMKVVLDEEHSDPLRELLTARTGALWSSRLLELEAHRVSRQLQLDPDEVREALMAVSLVTLRPSTLEAALTVGQDNLRSLDAIHLAAALELGDEMEAMVVYDRRLAISCGTEDLPVLSPGLPNEWWTS